MAEERPKTIGDILNHINMKPLYPCPECRNTVWQINSTSSDESAIYEPYGVVTKLSVGSKPYYMFHLIPLNCTQCGHVRFYSFPHIEREIDGKKA